MDLEAKILGERAENYCDSDEGEHEEDRGAGDPATTSGPKEGVVGGDQGQMGAPKWGGTSQNTGPKGVLRDWELYKEHQEILRREEEQNLIRMVKESSLSCRTEREDQQAAEMLEEIHEKIADEVGTDPDLEDLLSDKVLEQFIQKRMELMSSGEGASGADCFPRFGVGLVEIASGDEFLQIVDGSDPRVPVVVHIYDDQHPECARLNECLASLSELYPRVQFCKMRAREGGMSAVFQAKGVPALLVYKGGSLIGNYVRLGDEFGTEFYVGDVENFLIENGMIEDRANIPALLAAAKKKAKLVK
ncbi:phosducin-like protein isoform X3 [Folsomia candida]|uniref:Phosducin-like protein n=2 Tax=Folsomia candida TaxID=158441 RepID=A0A226CXI6_FOLCA|nr:phosducin-like protein isoform X3 [Folsomia candida]OXA37248.1 Phosducin-like protein [Folsomia candida]